MEIFLVVGVVVASILVDRTILGRAQERAAREERMMDQLSHHAMVEPWMFPIKRDL